MASIVTIGDCIIDEVRSKTQEPRRFPGGSGLNFAAGIAKLGLRSTLITRIGEDRNGFFLVRYARDHAIKLVKTPTVDPTDVAISTRINGEPNYSFSHSAFRRRILFADDALGVLSAADVVVVNAFPFDNLKEAADLAEALTKSPDIRILDPNPRPSLILDMGAYRRGFELALPAATLVKISDEDIGHLYGADRQSVTSRIFSFGVETILISHGAEGATIFENTGLSVHVPIVHLPQPILDTMGAGDATLASVISDFVRVGRPRSQMEWRESLTRAMVIAAATCRNPGAELALP
jgi:fructokinase